MLNSLQNRKKYAYTAVFVSTLILIAFDTFVGITPSSFIPHKYKYAAILFLFVYKIVELFILMRLFFVRYLKNESTYYNADKIFKHLKLMLYLIPQGNIVFGIISYKISGSLPYYFLFMVIAVIALKFVENEKLEYIVYKYNKGENV